MGPLELADFIGLDVCLHVMEVLHEGFGAPHMAPPPVLRQLVDAGYLGQKTGRGFYVYPRPAREPRPMSGAHATGPGPSGDVFIVSAVRTPIGRFGGSLADVPATTLGGIAIDAAVERAGVARDGIDEVLMGQVLQGGAGQAPARQAALAAGLADTTSATTINRVCGSGLKAIMLAAAEIRAGDAEVAVAGGMENMDQGPYLLRKARFGYRLGPGELVDSTVSDGLWCAIEGCHMGTHAERVAVHDRVSRADQDAFALASHQKAIAAIDAGRFVDEIVPVPVRQGREEVLFSVDEGPRRDTSAEALGPPQAGVRPADRR